MIKNYQNLEVYKRSYDLAIRLHKLTMTFPSFERYEIGSQIRRSAVSIVLNIVEGYGRKSSPKEFRHFLRNALGSNNELRVLLKMANDLGYLLIEDYQNLEEQYEVLSKQLYRLMEKWAKI